MKYRVVWDNEHACDTLPGEYDTEREAKIAGENWKREMVAMETTRKGRREAKACYQWEVVEVEAEPEFDPEAAPDNPPPIWSR